MIRAFTASLLMTVLCNVCLAEEWRGFLGRNGRATAPSQVPTKWSAKENMLWKADLPGSGSSSPIVVGQQLVLTCYVDEGTPKRSVMSFDKTTGGLLWQTDFPIDYREDPERGYLTEHGYASNSPVGDGKSIFVFFGKGGVHRLDLEGNKLWSVDVGQESSNRQWGSASSLIEFDDVVIVNAAEESKSIIALNKEDGTTRWKQEASMLELTYGTPRLKEYADGKKEVLISVPSEVWALDSEAGKLQWYASTSMTGNICPSIILDGDIAYSFGGYRSSGSIAIRLGGKDDVSESHTIWTSRLSSYVATPVLVDGFFYWVNDRGVAYSMSAESGEQIYQERIGGIGGSRPVYASPIFIGNYIYVVTRRSGTLVYRPGSTFNLVSQNTIEGDETDFNASPAVDGERLYLRSDQGLYCIGN